MSEVVNGMEVGAQGANSYLFGPEGIQATCTPELIAGSAAVGYGALGVVLASSIRETDVPDVSTDQSTVEALAASPPSNSFDSSGRLLLDAQEAVALTLDRSSETVDQAIDSSLPGILGVIYLVGGVCWARFAVRRWRKNHPRYEGLPATEQPYAVLSGRRLPRDTE